MNFFRKLRRFRRRYPPIMQALGLNAAEFDQRAQHVHAFERGYITIQVMAITLASPAHKHAVNPLLKRQQHMMRRHAGRAHHPDNPHIGRILQSTNPSQVSSRVRSPGAQKADDFGFKIV
jgi:hypothetical protein